MSITYYGWQRDFIFQGSPPGGDWEDGLLSAAFGGRGSGKSIAGAIRALHYMASQPGSRGVITAPTAAKLRGTTLPALKKVLEMAGLAPAKDFTYKIEDQELHLHHSGSMAFLVSTDQEDSLRGYDAAWGWMDEPRDSSWTALTNLKLTLRQHGYPRQLWLTTTPSGRAHWLCKLFRPDLAIYKADEFQVDPSQVGSHIRYWTVRTQDNPFGGWETYQQNIWLWGEGSPMARQELGGEFVLVEGLVFPMWDRDLYALDRKTWPGTQRHVIAGVDFGFANPSAILVIGTGEESPPRRYLLDLFYKRGCSEHELITAAKAVMSRHKIERFICDSADPRWISAMRRAGLPAIRARKSVGTTRDMSSGLGLCTRVLALRDPEKRPLFLVDPNTCQEFINEIEGYVWMDSRADRDPLERPKAKNDHALAAWRYGEEYISRHYDPVHPIRAYGPIPMEVGL